MNKFLGRHKLTKLSPEETDELNSPIFINEIEFVI